MLNRNCNKKIQEKLEELIEKARVENGQAVYLNIYHLSSVNYIIQLFGFGFFHTTIEVNEIEYSFTPTDDENSGIVYNKLGEGKKDIWLKEKIYLGNTIYDDDEIKQLLFLNIPYWLGKSYEPFMKNGNHFTKFLAGILLRIEPVANYPLYVNRFIEYGIFLNSFYSPLKRINQGNKKINEEQNSSGSNDIFEEESLNIRDSNSILNNDDNQNNQNNNNNVMLDVCFNKKNFKINNRNIINDEFFKKVIEKNIFLKRINYTNSNNFMKKLFTADNLLITEKRLSQSLNIYQTLLKDIDKENDIHNEFEKYFSIDYTKYQIDENSKYIKDKNLILKLKLLHSLYYIFFLSEVLNQEEIIAHSILKLNKYDYYSKFYLAIIYLKKGNIEECYKVVEKGMNECQDFEFKSDFSKFKLFLEEFHNCK